MKQLITVVALSLILAGSIPVLGQNPVPPPDTTSIPVKEGDPAVRTLPPGLDYVEERKRITPEDVPERVKQTLESSAQYVNWQRAIIYHDQNKEEFLVEFNEKGTTTTYRFDKQGRPIVENK